MTCTPRSWSRGADGTITWYDAAGQPVTPGTDEPVTWTDPADGTEHRTTADEVPDGLEKVGEHHNDLGDWCPWSGSYTAGGTCPQHCHEADVLAGFDAGDRELPHSTDLDPELYDEIGGVKYARHPEGRAR